MKSKTHIHRAKVEQDVCYRGPATGARKQNPAAHGNILRLRVCACGAVCQTNINGVHVERGAWISATEVQS